MTEFRIYTKTLLANSVREIICKWIIDNYTNNSKIDIITILITNLWSEISTNKDNSIPIYYCQVTEIDSSDKDNIDNVSQNTVTSWQEIIRGGEYPPSKRIKAIFLKLHIKIYCLRY